jgi:Cellulose biosynthesis protein BcsS
LLSTGSSVVCVFGAFRSIKLAALVAAASIVFPMLQATAGEQSDGQAQDLRTVLFGSLDTGHSTFGTVGVKRTLRGSLDQSGPLGMASLGYGGTIERVEFQPEGARMIRHAVHASALLGYQWVGDGIVVAALAGPEIEGERFSRHAPPRATEPHLGARLHGEIWAHPTPNTLATATVIAGTARTAHVWGRASAGYAVWDGIFLGPEASVYMTETYRELRLGAHVTGLTLGGMSLRFSGGWRGEDETRHHGAYVGLSAHIRM